ncbi:hypothetical protein DFH27DRAFT_26836 [Peziza echinospora]|nr:hypothetical protein DFH27DRAFT_26836 [Peziza echinospora]
MRTSSTLMFSLAALSCLFSIGTCEASPAFNELARDVNDEALHAALHDVDLEGGKQYRHGIFRGDRDALEAVRREKEEEAVRIVKLAKRQSNSTSSTTSHITTTTTATTTLPPVTTKRTTTVTNSNGDLQTITELVTLTPTEGAPTQTSSTGPGLQTGAAAGGFASGLGWVQAGAVGAVVVGGWML